MNPFRDLPFFYVETNTSELAKQAFNLLPPSNLEYVLPKKWVWSSPEKFLRKYVGVGSVYWVRNHNYHMLLINGHKVLCLWTVNSTKARLEVNEVLFSSLVKKLTAPTIERGYKGFYGQFQVTSKDEIEVVMQEVKRIYGL